MGVVPGKTTLFLGYRTIELGCETTQINRKATTKYRSIGWLRASSLPYSRLHLGRPSSERPSQPFMKLGEPRRRPTLARTPQSIGGLGALLWTLDMAKKSPDLESMSVDELWALHLEITAVLTRRISAEKTQLERRLHQLQTRGAPSGSFPRERRPYPQVYPKYRNPAKPSETWAGRGKQPRWLIAQLRSGKKLDDFRIERSSDRKRRLRSRS